MNELHPLNVVKRSGITSWLGLGEPSKGGGAAWHTSKPGMTACTRAWPKTNSSIPKTLQLKRVVLRYPLIIHPTLQDKGYIR